MLAEASNACYYSGDVPRMLEAGERAQALVAAGADGPEAVAFAALAHGMAHVCRRRRGGGRRVDPPRRGAAGGLGPTRAAHPILLAWGAMGPLFLREGDAGRGLVTERVGTARDEAALAGPAVPALHVARDHAASDRVDRGRRRVPRGHRRSRGRPGSTRTWRSCWRAWPGSRPARVARRSAGRHAAEAARLSPQVGVGMHDLWALRALGELELGLGHAAEAAVALLEELDGLLAARGVGDVDLSPAPELVEAYLRLGRRPTRRRRSPPATRRAPGPRASRGRWPARRAARGCWRRTTAIDGCFAEALALHARTPDAFEAARTRLAYGARLRRARRRTDARTALRRALDDFDRLGAVPWAERAGRSSPPPARPRAGASRPTRDRLTPQELQIALLLADGRTTREAAAAMFLSPKTVEYHLRNVYRKLDVRSREELAAAMAAGR